MLTYILSLIGLEKLIPLARNFKLNIIISETLVFKFPFLSNEEVAALYHYPVPQLSADGSCSISTEPAEEKYNLAECYDLPNDPALLKNHPITERLWRLQQVVRALHALVGVDWLGIYRKTKTPEQVPILLKEAYVGAFSRAEFPLTPEFAAHSNNSTVGLSGKVVLVQDVAAYAGPYYVCDNKVQSEFCLPILTPNQEVAGIIDAESFQPNFFTPEKVLEIVKVSTDLGYSPLFSTVF